MATRKPRSDARLNATGSETRKDRHEEDRAVTQNRELTDDERLEAFRKTFFQSALPDLPPIEGYHVCWLTTTNPRDPIHARIRLGYEPIKSMDVLGWEHASLKTGEWIGCIGVNEMVAFKLPMKLYESYMYEAHHRQPLEEEGKLNAAREAAEAEASALARSPITFELEEGNAELGVAPEPPPFAKTLGERD
jgi:hypothetical protein